LKAIGDADEGYKEVFFELNGQPRSVLIYQKQDASTREAKAKKAKREKVDPSNKGMVGAPMPGLVISVRAAVNTYVKKGDPLCVLSAMKMETVVTAPIEGKVARVLVTQGDDVAANDVLLEIIPQSAHL